MPQMSAADNPALAKQMLDSIDQITASPDKGMPPLAETPIDTQYELCGGYLEDDGATWTTTFQVRELTGRDEEFLARIKESHRILLGVLERGLVRVGDHQATTEIADSLLAGDWETVLLAIRAVTFGQVYESVVSCISCGEDYEIKIDLISDIPRKTARPEDIIFEVVGRHGTSYRVTNAYGAVQRKIMSANPDTPVAEANTLLLKECLLAIDGQPLVSAGQVLDLPMMDRRTILNEIDERRVGPKLREVRTKCPLCDVEQPTPLSVAALFQ